MLRLLYNVSAEQEARAAIGATDAPRVVMKQVLACNEAQLPLELAALAINLAADAAGATAMADNGTAVRQLLDKLYQSHDQHLTKLMRNLAMHANVAEHLLPFAADLVALAQQVDAPELLVELLGIIGSLPLGRLPDLPQLVDKYNLVYPGPCGDAGIPGGGDGRDCKYQMCCCGPCTLCLIKRELTARKKAGHGAPLAAEIERR